MVRSPLQKRLASALLLTTIAVQLNVSGAWSALQTIPVFTPIIGVQGADAQSATRSFTTNDQIRAFVTSTPGGVLVDGSTSLRNDATTAQKICQIAGYNTVSSRSCTDPDGRCNYTSCGDNFHQQWNGSSWSRVGACGGQWLAQLTCSDPINVGGGVQCQDGVDNDGDGKIDALVTGTNGTVGGGGGGNFSQEGADPKYNKTWITTITCRNPASGTNATFGNGDAQQMAQLVSLYIRNKGLNLTQPQQAIVRSDGGSDWDNPGTFHTQTLNAVCQIFGDYNWTYVSSTCRDNERSGLYPSGKCNFHSPGDNNMHRFSGTLATPTGCNDGIDNDGDGRIDLNDTGCANANDLSEIMHDPQCTGPTDNTESDAACSDGADNDGDGLVDFPQDPGCVNAQDTDESNASQCNDGVDNDGDGAIDTQDFSCGSPTDNDETNPKAACQDGVDNDGDGLVDTGANFCGNLWKNGSFDQGNTNITTPYIYNSLASCVNSDSLLPDYAQYSIVTNPNRCHRGFIVGNSRPFIIFNGGGGSEFLCQTLTVQPNKTYTLTVSEILLNSNNPAALSWQANGQTIIPQLNATMNWRTRTGTWSSGQATSVRVCGVNPGTVVLGNDWGVNDIQFALSGAGGACTAAADPGCENNQDNNESNAAACQDGIDNDGDGATDFPADFSCTSPTDNDETNQKAACQDGVDNDGDGKTDFPQDPGCVNKQDNDEFNQLSQCQDGIDNDGDGAVDLADFSCGNNPNDTDETNPKAACQDGIDNDGDGKTDYPQDPGCANKQDNDESSDGGHPINVTCPNGQPAQFTGYKLSDEFPVQNGTPGAVFDTRSVSIPVSAGDRFFLVSYPVGSPLQYHYTDDEVLLSTGFPGVTITQNYSAGNLCNGGHKTDPVDITGLFQGPLNSTYQTLTLTATFKNICGSPVYHTPYYVHVARCSTQCNDGIDNDGDGAIDTQDFSCGSPTDNDETNPKAACQDGVDNDGDGKTDFPQDPGCVSNQDNDEFNQVTQCNDGIDNDGDGYVDLADAACTDVTDNDEGNDATCQGITAPANVVAGQPFDAVATFRNNTPKTWNATAANAGNGFKLGTHDTRWTPTRFVLPSNVGPNQSVTVNFRPTAPTTPGTYPFTWFILEEGKGALPQACTRTITVTAPLAQCQDGIDNDGDGATDFPADFSCTSPTDNDETNQKAACQDGVDNDGDGKTDFPQDPGCVNKQDNDEFDVATPQCRDGIDNDGDGRVDFPADPGCTNQDDTTEDGDPACADRIDNDNDGLVDFPLDPGCSSLADTDEFNAPLPACRDGIDNDNDGRIDSLDPGCSNPDDTNEGDDPACSDRIDNDSDGLIDFPFDPGCASPTDTDEFNQTQTVDLTIQKAGPASVVRGQTLFYSILVGNSGTTQATNVTVSDTVPAGLVYNDSLSYGPCILSGNNVVSCPLGTLAANQFGSFYIAFDTPTVQNCSQVSVTNVATISGTQTDSNPNNNTSSTQGSPTRIDCPVQTTQCNDFNDNDFDGRIDFPSDPGCSSPTDNNEGDDPACSDRVDNDNDGLIDFPQDPGCSSLTDTDESNVPVPQCRDGIDNDGDGRVDSLDPGCSNPDDTNEGDDPACSDRRDNDSDGLTDFPQDPGCASPTDTDEFNAPNTQCRDGIDNDGDGRVDTNDAGCSNPDDNNEGDGAADLSIVLTGPATVQGGSTAAYVATISNNGPDAATSPFSIRVSIPTGVTFNAAQSSQGCTQQSTAVVCSNITLGLFQQTTRSIVFNVPGNGQQASAFNLLNVALGVETAHAQVGGVCNTTFQVVGTIQGVQPDSNQANNQSQVTTSVTCQALPQCSDGIDNDGDGKVDFPADPGCSSAADTDETDVAQFGCVEIKKETFDPHGNPLPIAAQFTFILDATRVAYNDASGRARFDNLTAGTHSVAEIIPSGWTQLSVSPQNGMVTVTPGTTCAQVTFRNRQVFVANAQCADGYDNDGDGLTDYPQDQGCSSATDNDEYNSTFVPQCSDNVDNDGDGLKDYPLDTGCENAADNNEQNAGVPVVYACSDNVDNDGDGLKDYPQDPGCSSATDTDETNGVVGTFACNDGIDNDNDGLKDYPQDTGCSSATDTDEFNFRAPRCSDGIDNDGDGLKDYPQDTGCTTAYDDNEYNDRLWLDRWREFWNWNW